MPDAPWQTVHARSMSWRDARSLAADLGERYGNAPHRDLRRGNEGESSRAAETVDLPDALGRVLASDLVARHDIPHFASSAMDGWAVAGPGPWRIDSTSTSTATTATTSTTTASTATLTPGGATPVVTGGVIPPGATSILRSEHALVDGGLLSIAPESPDALDGLPDGRHIRRAGEETRRGETIIAAGTVLNPAHLALAALASYDDLVVACRPTVRFVFTGDEVDEHGTPAPGRVRDTFGVQLPALLCSLGADVIGRQRARDTLSSTVEALEASIHGCDIVITTGGTGHSSADQLRDALLALGSTVLFDGIAMRPGGPTMFARAANGCLIVSLPGNPLAAMVGLFTVVEPLVAAFAGRPPADLGETVLGITVAGRPGTTLVVPYRVVAGRAWPSDHNGSAMMRGLADAAGLLVIPPEGVAEGQSAEVVRLPWATR